MTTNYTDLIPNKVLFNLREIDDLGIIKMDMAKKLISKGILETVRVGTKIHVSRAVLIKYLEDNTVAVAS
ncbi:DNA-binding protein [Sulfurimonas hydrogeniphila]|uniref:DNA-binding protein n=1 Tax=Sulfurimonas TaxID=202746 RepID=UPI00125F787C|nr:DNA-binding protein [Sulfurimonas hydrogeniphila]